MTTTTLSCEINALLAEFGTAPDTVGGDIPVVSPIDGSPIASLRAHDGSDLDAMIADAERAFPVWHAVPPPVRLDHQANRHPRA
jgi:aldehyde dehydrogenase (NAD+)